MKLVSESELYKLLLASERLARLDAFGVCEWNLYEEALNENEDFGKDYDTWVEVDLPDLLKEYTDHNITDDNYNFE